MNVKKYLNFSVVLTAECLMMEIGLITGYGGVVLGPLQDQVLQESLTIKKVTMKGVFERVSAMTGSFITLLDRKTFHSKREKEQSPNLLQAFLIGSFQQCYVDASITTCICYSLLADVNCTMYIVDADRLYPRLISSTDSY